MILDEYAEFLTSQGIRFSTTNGFSVWFNDLMISITTSRSGTISLSSYIGIVSYGKRNADRLTKVLLAEFPGYRIYPDKYSGYYEIEIEQDFRCTAVTALHKAVVAMAEVLEKGYEIGTEMLGTEMFQR